METVGETNVSQPAPSPPRPSPPPNLLFFIKKFRYGAFRGLKYATSEDRN